MLRHQHTSRARAGFSLVELLVAMAVAALLITGILSAFNLNSRLARVQTQMAEMQQSARIAQYDLVKFIRMTGRGGVPSNQVYDTGESVMEGIAIELRNNVGSGEKVGDSTTPEVVEDTDVLTLRGVFKLVDLPDQPCQRRHRPDGRHRHDHDQLPQPVGRPAGHAGARRRDHRRQRRRPGRDHAGQRRGYELRRPRAHRWRRQHRRPGRRHRLDQRRLVADRRQDGGLPRALARRDLPDADDHGRLSRSARGVPLLRAREPGRSEPTVARPLLPRLRRPAPQQPDRPGGRRRQHPRPAGRLGDRVGRRRHRHRPSTSTTTGCSTTRTMRRPTRAGQDCPTTCGSAPSLGPTVRTRSTSTRRSTGSRIASTTNRRTSRRTRSSVSSARTAASSSRRSST